MIDSTLLRFTNNIYPRCHRKTRANKNNFAAFFKFSSIKYIIRRNNNTNRNFFVKLIKMNYYITQKGYCFYNFKENNNNSGIKRFFKLCLFL